MYTTLLKGIGFVFGCSIISYAIVTFLRLILFGLQEGAFTVMLLWSPLSWGWLAWVIFIIALIVIMGKIVEEFDLG